MVSSALRAEELSIKEDEELVFEFSLEETRKDQGC